MRTHATCYKADGYPAWIKNKRASQHVPVSKLLENTPSYVANDRRDHTLDTTRKDLAHFADCKRMNDREAQLHRQQ